jgi:hypothetical protein
MKVKALLAALFVAGVSASLALGATAHHRDGTTSTSTVASTTTTTEHQHCHSVALAGAATSGTVAFKVDQTSKSGEKLVGSAVTVNIPAGAHVLAIACTDASGALTLRSLNVGHGHKGPGLEHHGDGHDH